MARTGHADGSFKSECFAAPGRGLIPGLATSLGLGTLHGPWMRGDFWLSMQRRAAIPQNAGR